MAMISKNPATGEALKEFDEITDTELERRLQAAADAFESFRQTSFGQRARWMMEAADILESESRGLGELMTREMGKPVGQAVAEAKKCAWVCRYYAEHAESFLADEPVETDAQASWVKYQPLGPVLAVMPWNFPFWQLFRFAAPGLMAGNVGLLKHASNVPQCALAIEDIFRRAGFPDGVFQTLLIGAGRVEGLLDDPRIKAATLTGSEPAGSAVAQQAGRRIKKTVLELGGSDPFIVMPSADMDAAVSTAVKARVQNNGQSCIAAKRFILHEAIAGEFTERFVHAVESLTVGDPLDDATDVGPLATEAIRNELAQQVDASVAAGAELLTGGTVPDRPGWYYTPTVLTAIPDDSPAAREELFGPVASLFVVQDTDEAIARANATDFGLGAAAWTADIRERERFIDGLDAGCVFINSMVASDPRLPFGGVKRSGYGRELSVYGIREFVNIKTVSTM
ncbi:MAG: NAD-dependent succinate-semialdehyde dehydrogenase [Gemmatimonadota bacterium]|jgi:succinate-semialdehyde dehydrogenase / glutarate-semialdehyde dehydrogenase